MDIFWNNTIFENVKSHLLEGRKGNERQKSATSHCLIFLQQKKSAEQEATKLRKG